MIDKLTINFQNQFKDKLIYDSNVFDNIDKNVKLHDETKIHPLSSAQACINVLGSMMNNPDELICFLNHFDLEIEELIEFPTNCIVDGRRYNDKGYVVFEWVGPQISPINEKGGGRGNYRTSIDAFVLARINGKTTQLLIEWKFTEGKSRALELENFAGLKGIERLNRYAKVLVPMRGKDIFPFQFSDKKGLGLYDFSADHLYQLLRMILLAKMTTPIQIGHLTVEDYRVVHLSHSQNIETKILHDKYLQSSPGLKKYAGKDLYDVWKAILSPIEKEKFKAGYWDLAIKAIEDEKLREYLEKRY
jgi:hypothetical protein